MRAINGKYPFKVIVPGLVKWWRMAATPPGLGVRFLLANSRGSDEAGRSGTGRIGDRYSNRGFAGESCVRERRYNLAVSVWKGKVYIGRVTDRETDGGDETEMAD